MKNSILVLSLAVTLLCGFLIVHKNREMEVLRARMAAADEARASSAVKAVREERRNKSLQDELRESRLDAAQNLAVAREPAPTNNAHHNVNQLLRDQLMKEALRAEAQLGSTKSIQKLFDAGLAARLQLNDNQSAALRQLLEQRASILWNQLMIPTATGDLDASNLGATGQGIKQAIEDNASQIRQLLGNDGCDTWQWFDKTQGERDEANKFATAAANAGQGLTPDQQTQLVDLMTSERASYNFQYDIGDPEKLDFQNWLGNFSEDRLSAYQQDMEQLNNRIVQGAQSFLTQDQAAQLSQALAQHLLQSMVTARGTLAMMSGNNR